MLRFQSDDALVNTEPYAVKAALQRVEETFHPHHHVWVMAAQAAIRSGQVRSSQERLNVFKLGLIILSPFKLA